MHTAPSAPTAGGPTAKEVIAAAGAIIGVVNAVATDTQHAIVPVGVAVRHWGRRGVVPVLGELKIDAAVGREGRGGRGGAGHVVVVPIVVLLVVVAVLPLLLLVVVVIVGVLAGRHHGSARVRALRKAAVAAVEALVANDVAAALVVGAAAMSSIAVRSTVVEGAAVISVSIVIGVA